MRETRENPGRRWSPTVRRQRLAHVLARLRDQDGRSAAQVADALGVAESTVTRLETPKHLTLPKPDLITRLLDVYGADDDTRAAVAALVVEARQRDWWHRYKPGLPAAFTTYLGLEGEVASLRVFQAALIPAVIATAEYATVSLCEQLPNLPEEDVVAFVAERHERHLNLLIGPDPVRVWAVLGEAALRQAVGGPEVMAEQMRHLQRLAEYPNFTLTVLPFAAGAHAGVGPFALLTFPEPADPEMAYFPDPLGGHWAKGSDVEDLRAVFEEILLRTCDRDATLALIEEAAADFTS